jgi:NAD(P)-dependent dehydrogenase (short-subunit alcohol dehydrogenase family)
MPESKKTLPKQHQHTQPGRESDMIPAPASDDPKHIGSGKLTGKVALITGGDSGIGRAVAIAFAKEGANIAILYLNEHDDAQETTRLVEQVGQRCIIYAGNIQQKSFCDSSVKLVLQEYGHIDVLVNNAAEQHPQKTILDISEEQLIHTFKTNIFSFFYMTQAVLPQMKEGSCIINTTSVTAYKGSPQLLDYSSTKGAIVAFTRSLALALAEKNIRVNAVAPGPIWTPLIPSTFPEEKVESFGGDVPLARPGQPEEVAPSYVFLATDESSYMTGQVLHPNGGTVVNG